MFRSLPPRGRFRAQLLATLLLGVVLAVPAMAAGQTSSNVTLPESVTGEDFLSLTVPAADVPVEVQILDIRENVSMWTVAADDLDPAGTAAIDLAAPDEGTRPVNGLATVTVSVAPRVLYQAPLTIDLDPPAPKLVAVARPGLVRLSWTQVDGPGPVTYRLQRLTGDDWSTLQQGTDRAYADRNLEPGRYRYRLVALVPAATRGLNSSTASMVGAVVPAVVEPEPTPSPDPEPSTDPSRPRPTATAPVIPKPKIPELPPRPRNVSVAGNRAESIEPVAAGRRPPQRLQYSDAPALGGLQSSTAPRSTAVVPEIAERSPRPAPVSAPTVAPRAPAFPVTVPPVGTLALSTRSGTGVERDLLPLAAALIVVVVGAHIVVRWAGSGSVSSAADDRP